MKYEINIRGDYAELIFNYPKFGQKIALINIDDLEKFKNQSLHIMTSKNEYRVKLGINKFLHREIMNCPKGMVVDHINGNSLDNRKSNLRICTQSENQRNRKVCKNNKTGYTGISIKDNLYIVQVGKTRKWLGQFKDIKDAIRVRNKYYIENGYKINDCESEG